MSSQSSTLGPNGWEIDAPNEQLVTATTNPVTGENEFLIEGIRYPVREKLVYPNQRIKLATFGDSYAEFGVVNNVTAQDVRVASATNTPIGQSVSKSATWVQFFSGGVITPVFSGGIGGQTTTQIAGRAVAASSMVSTSKSLIDAQTFGADIVIISASVNDFTGLTTGSSAGTIESTITTALANLKKILSKAKSLGLHPVFHSVMPYGVTPVTANQTVVNAATADYNARARAILGAADYFDGRSLVQASDGGWMSIYSTDGTHPNQAGAKYIYEPLAKQLVIVSGINTARSGLPKGQNMFSNADLSASAGGLATGISIASVNGTTTQTIEFLNGVNTQQIVWTPGNASGTDSTMSVDITGSAAGASPFVSVAVNDIVGVEYDIEIDDGAGNASSIYSFGCYLRKSVGATATIYNSFISTFAGSPVVGYQNKISGKAAGGFIQIDEATSASSGTIFSRISLLSQVQNSTVRLRISNIRFVKVPATY